MVSIFSCNYSLVLHLARLHDNYLQLSWHEHNRIKLTVFFYLNCGWWVWTVVAFCCEFISPVSLSLPLEKPWNFNTNHMILVLTYSMLTLTVLILPHLRVETWFTFLCNSSFCRKSVTSTSSKTYISLCHCYVHHSMDFSHFSRQFIPVLSFKFSFHFH